MRVLLDECVAGRLARELTGHDVRTVQRMAWGGLGDREVVRRAAAEFDVLLTVDRSLEYQQNLPANLSLITVISKSIEFKYLRTFVPQILEALDGAQPGDRIRISEPRQSR